MTGTFTTTATADDFYNNLTPGTLFETRDAPGLWRGMILETQGSRTPVSGRQKYHLYKVLLLIKDGKTDQEIVDLVPLSREAYKIIVEG